MAKTKSKNTYIAHGHVASNKKARFEYEVLETLDAGICLIGSEVKSLRCSKCNIEESYAGVKDGRIHLFNMHIGEWINAPKKFQHDPTRVRALLLRKKEQLRLLGLVKRQGLTLVPLSLYFNDKGLAKLKLGVGRGKKLHDKRETIKQRDWQRDQRRIMKKDYA